MVGLHDLTRGSPGLAVYVIHHNRKDDNPADYIDALSGTTGISGVVDHIAVMQRGRGEADAVLRFTSRDAAESDIAYKFDGHYWTELGNAADHALSKSRKRVLETVALLEEASLTDIASMADKDKSLTLRMLRGLADEGLVYQDGVRGPWKPRPNGPQSQQTTGELTDLTELTGLPGDDREEAAE